MPCENTDLQSKSSTHFSYQVFTTLQCSHILIAVCIKYGKRETVCVTDLPELLPTFRMWNLDIIPHSISEQLEGNLLCSVCPAAAGVGGSLTAGEPQGLPVEAGRARPRGQGLSRHPRRGAEQAGRESRGSPRSLPADRPRLGREVNPQAGAWARLRGKGRWSRCSGGVGAAAPQQAGGGPRAERGPSGQPTSPGSQSRAGRCVAGPRAEVPPGHGDAAPGIAYASAGCRPKGRVGLAPSSAFMLVVASSSMETLVLPRVWVVNTAFFSVFCSLSYRTSHLRH